MKKEILILLILALILFFGCSENGTDENVNDKNVPDKNILDTNQQIDVNYDINFDKTPKERMMEKLNERQEEIWDGEFPNTEFELGECTGTNVFFGEGVINISGWNQEFDYYNFLECSENVSLEDLAELRKGKTEELGGTILDKNVSTKKEVFEGREILVKNIEVEITGIDPYKKMHYFDVYEYRFYNCEGIILEGVSRIYGNDDWEPRKRHFIEVFNEMTAECKN